MSSLKMSFLHTVAGDLPYRIVTIYVSILSNLYFKIKALVPNQSTEAQKHIVKLGNRVQQP